MAKMSTLQYLTEGLRRIRKGSKFTSEVLAGHTGLSVATARKHLPALIEQGLVEVVNPPSPGAGKQGIYRRAR